MDWEFQCSTLSLDFFDQDCFQLINLSPRGGLGLVPPA